MKKANLSLSSHDRQDWFSSLRVWIADILLESELVMEVTASVSMSPLSVHVFVEWPDIECFSSYVVTRRKVDMRYKIY